MSRRCEVTGKAVLTGNLVSHSNVKTRHRYLPNTRRFKIASQTTGETFDLKITNAGMRLIEKSEGLDDLVLKQSKELLSPRLYRLRVLLKKLQRRAAKNAAGKAEATS